jgi:hypothetical protein
VQWEGKEEMKMTDKVIKEQKELLNKVQWEGKEDLKMANKMIKEQREQLSKVGQEVLEQKAHRVSI